MIHRASRDQLGLALRRYANGRITSDELEDTEVDWRDRGAVAVKEMSWNLYSDDWAYYAKDSHALSKETKKEIARWILFLQTEQEYLWPEYHFDRILSCWTLNLLTLGWWERLEQRKLLEFQEAGDWPLWPFCSQGALSEACGRPTFLRE